MGHPVRGACRVTKAFREPLFDDVARWLGGLVGQRAMAPAFHEIWAKLLHEVRSIPAAERNDLLPQEAKEGSLTLARLDFFGTHPHFNNGSR